MRNADYPLQAPGIGFDNVGAAVVINGADGGVHQTRTGNNAITHPIPRCKSCRSSAAPSTAAARSATSAHPPRPNILLPAGLQNATTTDDGKIWAFNAVGGGASGSWQFSSMTDPTPYPGSNFGGSSRASATWSTVRCTRPTSCSSAAITSTPSRRSQTAPSPMCTSSTSRPRRT